MVTVPVLLAAVAGAAWMAAGRGGRPAIEPTPPASDTASDTGAAPATGSVSGPGVAPGADSTTAGVTEAIPSPVGGVFVPVLLVPGWFDTERDLAALRIRLLSSGWPGERVEAITFEDPTGGNRRHAEEIDSAVQALLSASGADRIDIVAHSMGGLATRWYLWKHPDAPVRRVAFIASPHRGTISAHLAWGGGREEMMPGSPFLDSLNAAVPVPEGVEVVTVRTTVDTHIVPGESATLPGVPDHLLCCPTHAGLLHDEEVFEIVRAFLQDGPGERRDGPGERWDGPGERRDGPGDRGDGPGG